MLAYNRLARIFRGRLQTFHLGVLVFGLALVPVLSAQEPELARKVISRTAPSYPEMAKKLHLTGKVRLEVVIAAGGSVTSAKLVGGSPVFEKSAVEAVKQWKFQPADKDIKGIIVLEFTNQ